jgi:hypothetical protein
MKNATNIQNQQVMTTTWITEWEVYTKGQDFICEYEEDGVTKEMNGVIDYVVQNQYYSLIVLTNGLDYTIWTKLWLELNKQARMNPNKDVMLAIRLTDEA